MTRPPIARKAARPRSRPRSTRRPSASRSITARTQPDDRRDGRDRLAFDPLCSHQGCGARGSRRTTLVGRGCAVRQEPYPRGLIDPKGAVPDRARGLGHMAPTYFRREPGIDAPTAIAAPHFLLSHPCAHAASKVDLHDPTVAMCRMPIAIAIAGTQSRNCAQSALARRDAMPADRARPAAKRSPRARFPSRSPPGAIVSGFHAAQERDQSAAADAPARGCRRAAGAAGRRRARQAADHARLGVRRALGSGVWGIREPKPEAPEVFPDILLVPLAGVRPRRLSHRLWRRLLRHDASRALRAMKPIAAIGIAFAAQEIDDGADDAARRAARSRANRARESSTSRTTDGACAFFSSATSSAAAAALSSTSGCRAWCATGSSISSSSTARTRPAASASPRRSISELLDAGADAVTLGNHAWDQSEALVFIERAPRLVRPLNYPRRHAGPRRGADRGARTARACWSSTPWAASSWTRSTIRSPRSSASSPPARSSAAADAIIVDIHAEATSEKQAMGYFVDGRASLVVGTHTHVPTADHRILPAAPPSCPMSA